MKLISNLALTKTQKKNLKRILLTALLLILSGIFEDKSFILSLIFFAVSYAIISYDVLKKAWKGILRGRPLDENFLMAIASIGAIVLALLGELGIVENIMEVELTEGAAVMLFYQIGELFESIAIGKSRKNIAELIDIRPDYANVENELGELERVDPSDVCIGTIIVVKPGEKVPIDGVVTEGESSIDTAALTGESVLKSAQVGNEILSGSINMTGLIKLRTTKEFGQSTASKILDLVQNASSSKSRSEDFISKFARIYTPVVCISALALAVLPPLINLIFGNASNLSSWLYRALTFLVISCPCALVISVPLTFFGGLGGASHNGILIKGSNFMEPLSRSKYVVFDKTGTMTKGVFEVQGVHHCPIEDEKLIEFASHAECYSSHPIALSIQKEYGREIDRARVSDVHEISGEGITAVVDNYHIAVGNAKLMKRENVDHIDCRSHGTVVHVAIDGIYSGHILIADEIKPNAKKAIEKLRSIGVKRMVMLTGDSKSTAESVAREIGIEEVHSELLPGDKVSILGELLSTKGKKENLTFVGDGINDAPVLVRADVGIAMGAIGSDAAIEAADVVVMDDDPMKIAKAILIAKKCMRIVYENIYIAIGIKIICLILSAIGYASMWLAIFADTGVLIIAVLNAVRSLNVGKL